MLLERDDIYTWSREVVHFAMQEVLTTYAQNDRELGNYIQEWEELLREYGGDGEDGEGGGKEDTEMIEG